MTHGEAFDLDVPLPRVRECLDPIRREDQVQIKRPILELDEILAATDLLCLRIREPKAELAQGLHHRRAVLAGLLDEDIRVLRSVREAQQDRPGLAEKHVPYAMTSKDVADLLRLGILKARGHIP